MSATYNWAYKPGVTNKYGLIVPDGADDEKPSGWCYVALYGNDATGNGSRQYPYRTITKTVSSGSNLKIVLGSGVYREVAPLDNFQNRNFIGDGDVAIDLTYIGKFSLDYTSGTLMYNITFKGDGVNSILTTNGADSCTYKDVTFDGCWLSNVTDQVVFYNCIVANYSGPININDRGGSAVANNCTFVYCNNIHFQSGRNITSECIFYYCNISLLSNITARIQYSLFYACNFRLNGSGGGGVLYPSTPADYSYYATIVDLQAAFFTIYTTQSFLGCSVDNPLFNNPPIGDYTLSFASPAKNLSYFGTYVGARSIAQGLKISAIEADGDFDLSTAVNVTIADDSITLTNPDLDAIIETKVIENTLGRQLKSIPIIGFNADRNGQYIDSIADLDVVTKAAGSTLTIPASYLVESGAVTYNNSVYTAGQRLTTVSGETIFTTTTGGVLREILEAPQRHTIEMKLGDAQPFTTEAFNHFEPGVAPTTNNLGDSRLGTILRGNGDPDYVRGDGVEFPVNSRYIKIRFTIRVNNLNP